MAYSERSQPVQPAVLHHFLALVEALRLLPVEPLLVEASLEHQQVEPLRQNLLEVFSAALSPQQLEPQPRYSVLRLSQQLVNQQEEVSSVVRQEQRQASLARQDNLEAYSVEGQQQRELDPFLVNPQEEQSLPEREVRSLVGPSRKALVRSLGARSLPASSSSNSSQEEHSASDSPKPSSNQVKWVWQPSRVSSSRSWRLPAGPSLCAR